MATKACLTQMKCVKTLKGGALKCDGYCKHIFIYLSQN